MQRMTREERASFEAKGWPIPPDGIRGRMTKHFIHKDPRNARIRWVRIHGHKLTTGQIAQLLGVSSSVALRTCHKAGIVPKSRMTRGGWKSRGLKIGRGGYAILRMSWEAQEHLEKAAAREGVDMVDVLAAHYDKTALAKPWAMCHCGKIVKEPT